MISYFSKAIHVFVLIAYCHFITAPVWAGLSDEADYTIHVTRHVSKQRTAVEESLHIDIHFKEKKEGAFKGESAFQFVRQLFQMDTKKAETSSYLESTKLSDGKRLTAAEKTFLSHFPQFKTLSFNSSGSLFIEGLKDTQHTYSYTSDGEISFKNTLLKDIKIQASNVSIYENVALTRLSSNLQNSQGYFQIFPEGSLDVTFGEFKGGTFLNQGRLSAHENQTLDFKETSVFNEGLMMSQHAVDLQNMHRFENHGTIRSPNFKARGKSIYNLHQIFGQTQNLLAYDYFSNEGGMTGDSLKVVSLGAFYNAGNMAGHQYQQVVAQKDIFNAPSGVFSSSNLHITSFGNVMNSGQIQGETGKILAHLFFKNKGLIKGNLKNISLLSFSNDGEMTGNDFSVEAPHTVFTENSKIVSEIFHLETKNGEISGIFNVQLCLANIAESLSVLENAVFSVDAWALSGKGACYYKSINTRLSNLTFHKFGAFINEGVLPIADSVEGNCEHFTNLRTLEAPRFNLSVHTLKNRGDLKGGGCITLETGEKHGTFGSPALSLEIQRFFQNTGETSVQRLMGEGLFQNHGVVSSKGTLEEPVLFSITTFENGSDASQTEGRISINALNVLSSTTLKLSQNSFLHVPSLRVEASLPLLNEGEIETQTFHLEGDLINKGDIKEKDFSVSGLFTNKGNVECHENGTLHFKEVINEGDIQGEAWTLYSRRMENVGNLRAHQTGVIETQSITNAPEGVIEGQDSFVISSEEGFINKGIVQSNQKLEIVSAKNIENEGTMVSSDLTLKARKVQNKGILKGRQHTHIETTLGLVTLEGGSSFLNGLQYRTRDPSIFQNYGSLTLENLESFEGVTGFFNGKTGKLWIENAQLKLPGNLENEGYVSLGKGDYHISGKVLIGKEARLVAPHKEGDTPEILEESVVLPVGIKEALFSVGGMHLFAGAFENLGSIEATHSLRFLTEKATCGIFKTQETLYLQVKKAAKFLLKNHPLLRAKKIIIETETFLINQPLTLKSFLEVRAREFLNETQLHLPELTVHSLLFRNGESAQKPGSITSDGDIKVYAETIQNEFGHLFGKGDGLFISPQNKGDMTVGRGDQFKGTLTFWGKTTFETKSFKNAWGAVFSTGKLSLTCSEDFENLLADSFLATNSDFDIGARNITNRFGKLCGERKMVFKAEQTFMNHSGLIFGSQDATIEAEDFFNTRTTEVVNVYIANSSSDYKDSHWKTLKYSAADIQVQGLLTIHARNSGINLASSLFGGLGIHETGRKVEDTHITEEFYACFQTHSKTKNWCRRAKKHSQWSGSKRRETRVIPATRSSSVQVKTIFDFGSVTGTVSAPIVIYKGRELQVGFINPTVRLSGVMPPKRRLDLYEKLDPSLTQGFFTKGDRERRTFIGTRFSFGEDIPLPSMTFVTPQLHPNASVSSQIIPLFDQTTFQIATVKAFTQSFNRGYMTPHLSTLNQIRLLMENAKAWEEEEKRKEGQRNIQEITEDDASLSSSLLSEDERIDALKEPMIVFIEQEIENQAVAVPHILVPKRTFNPILAGNEGVVFADERLESIQSSTVTITGTVAAQEHVKVKAPHMLLLKNIIAETHVQESGKRKKKSTTVTTTHHPQPGGNLISGGLLEVDSETVVKGGTIAAQKAIFEGPLLHISSIIATNTKSTTQSSRKGMGAKGHQTTETETPAVARALLAVLELHINTDVGLIEGADVHAERIYNETEHGLTFGPTIAEMRYTSSQSQKSVMGHVKTQTKGGQEIEIPTTLNVGVIFSPDSSLTLTNVQWDKKVTEIQGTQRPPAKPEGCM